MPIAVIDGQPLHYVDQGTGPGFTHPDHPALAKQLFASYAKAVRVRVLASVVGVALANVIPIEWGLGFAGILALLGVLSSLASSPLRIVAAGVAGAAAVAAWALPLKLNILVAIACAVALCLLLEHLRPAREGAGRV